MIRVLSSGQKEVMEFFRKLDVDKTGIKIMLPKTEHLLIYIDSLNVPAANIVKQEMLSLGGDAALNKGACDFSVRKTPCVLMGQKEQYNRLTKKLLAQPFGLKKLAKELTEALAAYHAVPAPISLGSHRFDFANTPYVMGIINTTPDSFSGDGLFLDTSLILKKAEQMIRDGADILDVGGESTRPGANSVSLEEERRRVVPAVREIVRHFKIPLSIDTSKAQIAKECLDLGAHLVNDVTGLEGDRKMAGVVKSYRAPAVIMHRRFASQKPKDPSGEILEYFQQRIATLEKFGIASTSLILDPGIGFGKTSEQNLYIVKKVKELKVLGRPLLLGTSRKSFIAKALNLDSGDRLIGTMASIVYGYLNGCHIFRVHDVKEARQALKLTQTIQEADER